MVFGEQLMLHVFVIDGGWTVLNVYSRGVQPSHVNAECVRLDVLQDKSVVDCLFPFAVNRSSEVVGCAADDVLVNHELSFLFACEYGDVFKIVGPSWYKQHPTSSHTLCEQHILDSFGSFGPLSRCHAVFRGDILEDRRNGSSSLEK